MSTQVQIILKDGQPEYAVVPIETYQRLLDLAEDREDERAYDEAMSALARGEDEILPGDFAQRLLSGNENRLQLWREYRGLTQEALAQAVGTSKSYIAQIEAGKKPGAVAVLKRLAAALQVDLNDLAG